MSDYQLGVDLGTTYTAAAVHRDGRVEVAAMGSHTAVMPSVVLIRDTGQILVGEAAEWRGATEPTRLARQFKRRVGDATPLVLGGTPYPAHLLMGHLLRSVVEAVAEREGSYPAGLAITHPANWGAYKQDLLRQSVEHAGFGPYPISYLSEPEAAAIHYASNERVGPGAAIAVYDLGGGTFDATVLRRTADGFEILGRPEGVEHLGGIDFDTAVFSHVDETLDHAVAHLDPDDPTAVAATARLRSDCVRAKEVLSTDVDVDIPVLLPGLSTSVRLTRAEFEGMIRPALAETMTALRRALDSAGVAPGDLHSVLLVGGSSRIPLVGEMVGAALGRPVAVDTHPKLSVAQGAAVAAAAAAGAASVEQVVLVDVPDTTGPLPVAPMVQPAATGEAASAPAAAPAAAPPESVRPGGVTRRRRRRRILVGAAAAGGVVVLIVGVLVVRSLLAPELNGPILLVTPSDEGPTEFDVASASGDAEGTSELEESIDIADHEATEIPGVAVYGTTDGRIVIVDANARELDIVAFPGEPDEIGDVGILRGLSLGGERFMVVAAGSSDAVGILDLDDREIRVINDAVNADTEPQVLSFDDDEARALVFDGEAATWVVPTDNPDDAVRFADVEAAEFTPDGSAIIAERSTDEGSEVVRIPVDGGDEEALTTGADLLGVVGDRVLMNGSDDDGDAVVFVAPADGGDLERVDGVASVSVVVEGESGRALVATGDFSDPGTRRWFWLDADAARVDPINELDGFGFFAPDGVAAFDPTPAHAVLLGEGRLAVANLADRGVEVTRFEELEGIDEQNVDLRVAGNGRAAALVGDGFVGLFDIEGGDHRELDGSFSAFAPDGSAVLVVRSRGDRNVTVMVPTGGGEDQALEGGSFPEWTLAG